MEYSLGFTGRCAYNSGGGGGGGLISRSLRYVHHYISILYILCVISHLIKVYVTLLGLTCKHTS